MKATRIHGQSKNIEKFDLVALDIIKLAMNVFHVSVHFLKLIFKFIGLNKSNFLIHNVLVTDHWSGWSTWSQCQPVGFLGKRQKTRTRKCIGSICHRGSTVDVSQDCQFSCKCFLLFF